jgi:hypothetical protein
VRCGRPRHGLRDRTHSADRVPPNALLPVHLAQGMMQEDVGAAGRVRACVISDDGVEAEPCLHEFALEPAIEVIRGRFGQEFEQRPQIFRGEPTHPVAQISGFDQLAQAPNFCSAREVWRRLQHQLTQQIGTRIELAHEGGISLGIPPAEFCDIALGAALGGEEIAAVQGRKEVLCAALDNFQPPIEKAKIGNDLRIEQAHRVSRGRVSETGMKFFRDRSTAHDRSAFEHLDFQSGHAEVGGASQPIVTCTDDDDVVGLHRGASANKDPCAERNASCAALRHFLYSPANGTHPNASGCRCHRA